MSDSTSRASSSRAASRTYRTEILRDARIYVNIIPDSSLPEYVTNIRRHLLNLPPSLPAPRGDYIPSMEDVETALQNAQEDDLYHRALHLAQDVRAVDPQKYFGKTESKWMVLYRQVIRVFDLEPEFTRHDDQLWDSAIGPPAEGYGLSSPKPDIGFGLRMRDIDSTEYPPTASPSQISSPLQHSVLKALYLDSSCRLFASPESNTIEMAYPFLVFEAKSDSSSFFFAENQASGAASKAIAMLNNLFEMSDTDNDLPIFAITTQGPLLNVYICFYDQRHHAYNLKRLPSSFDLCNDYDNFYLQTILCKIVRWVKSAYLPKVESCTAHIYRQYIERTKKNAMQLAA